MNTDNHFWAHKRVFLTGHTGFKGSWLALWLQNLGAEVHGYSVDVPTQPALFLEAKVADGMTHTFADVRDHSALHADMQRFNPDIVIHMAAQSLVRRSYQDPMGTFATNVMGTVNVLECSRQLPNLGALLNVTTDKCYENKEWLWGYRENEPLGGHDPYSNSKACSELVTQAYRQSFLTARKLPVATARAGNVIGGGDWAIDRLIPDLLRAFEAGNPVKIRNPSAIRPWQHVLEPLSGYLLLTQKLFDGGDAFAEAWNFGPDAIDAQPVHWIVQEMVDIWGDGASWDEDMDDKPHEAQYLKLDSTKSREQLGWHPRWPLKSALKHIVEWHRAWMNRCNMREICASQITNYQNS